MNFDDVYNSMLLKRGGSVNGSDIRNSQDSINNKFKYDPSYKSATLRKRTSNTDSDLDTRVVNVDTDVYKKKIYVRPDTNIEAGDYIVYPDKTYLALSVEDNLISPCANSTFCNYTLKWMLNGEYFETQAIVTNNTKYTLGISSVSNSFIEGSGMFGAIISYNDKAQKIPLGGRFIVNGQAWEATQLDHSSVPNVLSLLLGESSKSTEYDDMENEIADAFLHNYTITLNSTSESIQVGGTFQINSTITDNSVLVTDTSNVIYISSDETIATVKNGLVTSIGVGNCIITATVGSASSILNLEVIAKSVEPVISYSCDWSTSKTSTGTLLKTYVSSTATLTETIDGVINESLIVNYTLDSLGTTLVNSGVVTITRKTNKSFLVKNVSASTSKSFVITFVNSADSSVMLTQVVQLTGM